MSDIDTIISDAVQKATENKHEYVTLEHLMFALLEHADIVEVLDKIDCDYLTAKDDLIDYLADNEFNGLTGEVVYDGKPKKTVSIERVLQRAFAQVIFSARDQVSPIDLFISILSEDNTHAKYLCELNGIERAKIVEWLTKNRTVSDTLKEAEQLEEQPAQYLPDVSAEEVADDAVNIDLTKPMTEILATLSQHPVKTRVNLTGPMIVARDIAHAKLLEQLDATGTLPDYIKNHPVYYAGPAKTPDGMASGSFGPTTAGRMDSYVDTFQKAGGSLVMLAKGNSSAAVRNACRDNGGFYLGSIGGVAAKLALESIKKVEVLEFPEFGMEAVWRIEVENFPAFIVMDDKGNDFFSFD